MKEAAAELVAQSFGRNTRTNYLFSRLSICEENVVLIIFIFQAAVLCHDFCATEKI